MNKLIEAYTHAARTTRDLEEAAEAAFHRFAYAQTKEEAERLYAAYMDAQNKHARASQEAFESVYGIS
jgi:hypothetical protein